MSAEITWLPRPRQALTSQAICAAKRFVALAEEALTLSAAMDEAEQRRTVCRISEAWLALAEAALAGGSVGSDPDVHLVGG